MEHIFTTIRRKVFKSSIEVINIVYNGSALRAWGYDLATGKFGKVRKS